MARRILCFLSFFVLTNGLEQFEEQLLLQPVNGGQQISASFYFKTFVPYGNLSNVYDTGKHHDIFPLSLFKMFKQHNVQELHLSLTKGVWKYEQWGIPVKDVPAYAYLWAWFTNNSNAKEDWKKLTRLLSGQFCASINLIDPTVTLTPKMSYRPFLSMGSLENAQGFLAALPQEAICTENLTPWTKLLPCRSKSGIASLLHATHIFNSKFFSMSLDYKYSCSDLNRCSQTTGIELIQSIVIVFDPPSISDGRYSWSLNSLFGTTLFTQCSLSSSSHVYVDVTNLQEGSKLITNTTDFVTFQNGNIVSVTNDSLSVYDKLYANYNINELLLQMAQAPSSTNKYLNIGIQIRNHLKQTDLKSKPEVLVSRHARGYGVDTNGIIITLTNTMSVDVYAIYLDMIPWYLRMYLHTLNIETSPIDSNQIKQVKPLKMFYEPAQDRIRPHHLELLVKLPPNSKTQISFEFEQQFLRWTEYPPDANHGLYINPSTVTIFPQRSNVSQNLDRFFHQLMSSNHMSLDDKRKLIELYYQQTPLRLYTDPILISMPTPDFSMPYNVLCLVSTVLSIAFGPLYNLTTRSTNIIERFYRKKDDTKCEPKRKWFFIF